MKRIIIILSIVFGLILALGVFAWWQLPSIVTFLLGRAIDGGIVARQSTVKWNGSMATMELTGVRLSGNVRGTIEKVRLDVKPGRGIYIKYGCVSGFDVIIDKQRRARRFLPFQLEYAEINGGKALYNGQTFRINSIKVRNFNTSGTFEFTLDGSMDGFGRIKTHGGGVWKGGRSDVSGTYQIVDFDLSRLLRGYEGRSDSKGKLTYRTGEWGLHGTAGADRFVMREKFLKKPVRVPRVECSIDIEASSGRIRTSLDRLSFKGVPLRLVLTNNGKRLERLELASGPLSIRDIKSYTSLSFVKRLPSVLNTVSGGKVSIRELSFVKPNTFSALLSVKDVEAGYKEFRFTGINGGLRLDRDSMALTGLRAVMGKSVFSKVSGIVPFSEKKEIIISGGYELDLGDVSHFLRNPHIRISSGSAEGVGEMRIRKEDTLRLEGTGRLKEAIFFWKDMAAEASGSFAFDSNGIDFSPLVVRKDTTELRVQGRMARDRADLKIEGQVSATDLTHLLSSPYSAAGSAGIGGRLEGRNGSLSWQGAIAMDTLAFNMPGIVNKPVGVPSSAVLGLRIEKGDKWYIDDLTYVLDAMCIRLNGIVDRNRIYRMRVAVDAPQLGRLFGNEARGEMKADIEIDDVQYPLVRLPHALGWARVRNGRLALPFLAKPLENIDLNCHFAGDRYEIDSTNLSIGESVIQKATLSLTGDEGPKVVLRARALNLVESDILGKNGEVWRIHTVSPGSLFSRVSGDVAFQAKRAQWGKVDLSEVDLKLGLAGGKLTLESGSAMIFGGLARSTGFVDLAARKPRFGLTGSIDRMLWSEMFGVAKGDPEIMKGSGTVTAELVSEGEDKREIIEELSGRISVSSKDGVIRKWSLLSKLFGLLNLYDLLQGKVNLLEDGLPYSVMSADFTAKKGIVKTRNFTIDSPSMYISGKGSVALPGGSLEGRIAVSPFVTIDKLLGKIPIIRNVLREKKEGFLFVVYNVSGPFHDPNLYSTYVESLPMRAYMILRNLIRLPKEVLKQ